MDDRFAAWTTGTTGVRLSVEAGPQARRRVSRRAAHNACEVFDDTLAEGAVTSIVDYYVGEPVAVAATQMEPHVADKPENVDIADAGMKRATRRSRTASRPCGSWATVSNGTVASPVWRRSVCARSVWLVRRKARSGVARIIPVVFGGVGARGGGACSSPPTAARTSVTKRVRVHEAEGWSEFDTSDCDEVNADKAVARCDDLVACVSEEISVGRREWQASPRLKRKRRGITCQSLVNSQSQNPMFPRVRTRWETKVQIRWFAERTRWFPE